MSQNKNTKEVLTRFETKNSKLCHKTKTAHVK